MTEENFKIAGDLKREIEKINEKLKNIKDEKFNKNSWISIQYALSKRR